MKIKRLPYDEWPCILSKETSCKNIHISLFDGYIALLNILEVSEPQVWEFNNEIIYVCDKGIKWLIILPKDEFYCITAMLNEKDEILLWYIDMIAMQGVNEDEIPYFYDLYLDLVVYRDGTIKEDDMDELVDALSNGDITQEQFELALYTSDELKNGLLSNIDDLVNYTNKCLALIRG